MVIRATNVGQVELPVNAYRYVDFHLTVVHTI